MSRSKLAKTFGLEALPRFLMGPCTAIWITGLRRTFLFSQVDGGLLPTVFLVPGFVRIHTDALETWYEGLHPQCLVFNKGLYCRPIKDRVNCLNYSACFWLQNYAHAITAHAIRTGYLIREPCTLCGEPNSEAHHPDYSEPLRVIWLCGRHHKLHHHRLRAAQKLILQTRQSAQLEIFPKSWLSQRETEQFCGGAHRGSASKTKRPLPDQPIITYDKLEAAQMLKVSVRQLDKYIDDGELPVSRMNSRAVRILRENLLDFLRSSQTNRIVK
jgi:Helix-turn-helix domain